MIPLFQKGNLSVFVKAELDITESVRKASLLQGSTVSLLFIIRNKEINIVLISTIVIILCAMIIVSYCLISMRNWKILEVQLLWSFIALCLTLKLLV